MDTQKIAEIKLACLMEAAKQCVNFPENTLKIAKEYFEWVMSIS